MIYFADNPVRELGEGGFGKVWLAKHKATGIEVAIKEMKIQGGLTEYQKSELFNAPKLEYDFLVKEFDYIPGTSHQTDQKVFLILEFCNQGSLEGKLRRYKKENKYLSEEVSSFQFSLFLSHLPTLFQFPIVFYRTLETTFAKSSLGCIIFIRVRSFTEI